MIHKNDKNRWCRKCPICDKELLCCNENSAKYHDKLKKECKSCCQKGKKAFWYGKTMSKKTKRKMSEARIGIKLSKETKLKLSLQKQGDKNPFFKKKFSKKHRENLRIAALKRLKKQGIMVAFNPQACEFIDEYGKKNGYNFRHALNGGEVCLSGFPVDGYDKEKNIVFEYDERYHRSIRRKRKDIYKQKCITKTINPKMFIRYDEWDNRLYDALTNTDLSLNNL